MKRIGQKVEMTEDAIDNYGEEYRGKLLTITHRATRYMPADEFYAKGKPEGFHPGFDETCSGQGLYDFEELGLSLYDWELLQPK